MTLFVRKALLFSLIVAAIFAALEIKARRMYASRTDLYLEAAAFDQRRDYEILFLGSSIIEKGVNPAYIGRPSFNLSFRSQDVYYDRQLLRKYIDQLPDLKIVVMGISLVSFGYDQEPWAANICKDYLWTFGIWPRSKHLPRMLQYSSVLLVHQPAFLRDLRTGKEPSPILYLDGDVDLAFPPDEGTLLYNGYRFYNKYTPRRFLNEHARQNADYHARIFNRNLLDQNMGYMRDLIDLCLRRGIAFYMITPPNTANYRRAVSDELKTITAASIDRLLMEYPSVVYLDFNAIDIYDEMDFFVSDHLNYRGARKFTVLLDRILHETPEQSIIEFDFQRISMLTADLNRMALEFEQLADRHSDVPGLHERIGHVLLRNGLFGQAERYFN